MIKKSDMNRTTRSFILIQILLAISAVSAFSAVPPQAATMSAEAVKDSSGVRSIPEGYALKDSVIYVPAPKADTLLAGKNIFSIMPAVEKGDAADVKVHQSSEIRASMNTHFAGNASRQISGYRIRIFFDNKQSSREDSQAVMDRFTGMYHDVPAYRSYVNPYFKVTVGDFRSKTEAMQLLRKIRHEFPAAFIVKEKGICYPAVDKENAVTADTLEILYRLPEPENEMTL